MKQVIKEMPEVPKKNNKKKSKNFHIKMTGDIRV